MNARLQLIMVIASILFLAYIVLMVRNRKIELKYILTWMLTGLVFILIALFPSILTFISKILNIIEPVNALFLSIIFLMLLIIFTLTIAISRNSNRVKSLTQEIGILKNQVQKLTENKYRDNSGDETNDSN